jgi:hypothetical protein
VTEIPSSDDPHQGLEYDVGVSAHEWRTRWSQIEEDRSDSPADALAESVGLLDEIAAGLAVSTGDTAIPPTEDVTSEIAALRALAEEAGSDEGIEDEELSAAFDRAHDLFVFLVDGRRESDQIDG